MSVEFISIEGNPLSSVEKQEYDRFREGFYEGVKPTLDYFDECRRRSEREALDRLVD